MDFSIDFDVVPIDDKWYTIQVIYEKGVATLYINGEQVKKVAGSKHIKV